MKTYTALFLFMSVFFTGASQAQVKRGGFFGFGRGDKSELSSELFPNTSSETSVPIPTTENAIESSNNSPAGFNIFKGGKPNKIDDVSYVIEDGKKVENATEEKKIKKNRGLFSFGKKKALEATGEAIELAPEATAPIAYQTPAVSEVIDPTLVPEELLEATNEEDRKKKGGFFGMFGKKKRVEMPMAPSTATVGRVNVSQPAAPVETSAATVPQPVSAPSPRQVTPITTANSQNRSLPPVVANSGTSKVQNETVVKEEKRGPRFLITPINKLKAAKKNSPSVGLSPAETIIQNGEIVTPSSTTSLDDTVSNLETKMPRQAPQVIDGATTYSSWDDVEGTTSSAVDKILRQMR